MKKTILILRPKNKIFIHDNYWKNLTLEFYNQNIINNYHNNIDLYIMSNRIKII